MNGETTDDSITLQIVHLESLEDSLAIEFSDTINKTRAMMVSVPDPQKIFLYSVVRVKYIAEPVDRMTTNFPERYYGFSYSIGNAATFHSFFFQQIQFNRHIYQSSQSENQNEENIW